MQNGDNFDSMSSTEDDQKNIWSSILRQVQNGASNKLPSSKAVLVLGDNETGKTSLIAKMQGNEDPKKGSGLEYHHVLVRDEYRDEHTRLGFWLLDGDVYHQNLLNFSLNDNTFADTTILLVASMNAPWDIIDSLNKWANLLEDHVKKLNLDRDRYSHFKAQNVRRYQEYISPGDEIDVLVTSPVKPRSESMTESIAESLSREPLPDNVLTSNLGLDVIVVITKTDFMSTLEKEYDFKEEAFDFIQQAIRKFCLRYGASLFYVSAKVNKNCDLLYKYLVHRIYGLPFKTPALVVEKDAVFIPAGWDNEKKIAILYENIQSCNPDDDFNDVIVKPTHRKPHLKDSEVAAEDDQVFLNKMQSQLQQNIPSSGSTPTTPQIRASPAGQKPGRTSMGSTASPLPGVQIDGAKGSPAGEGVLQNFFNSLLNRKSGAGLPNSPGTPRSTTDAKSRTEVAAELDRLVSGSPSKVPPSSLKKPAMELSASPPNANQTD
ncbi:Cytoplasmic dynein 1 light intermediate chain 2 [Halotydeus destructor]|nr:Cytoplasmic dynein 1 light intermediate chain 2 [Halotydeus destructor]